MWLFSDKITPSICIVPLLQGSEIRTVKNPVPQSILTVSTLAWNASPRGCFAQKYYRFPTQPLRRHSHSPLQYASMLGSQALLDSDLPLR